MTSPDRFATGRALGAWAYLPGKPLEGAPGGPLAGLTFSVKDLFHVEGWSTRGSTPAPLPPLEPSPLVRALCERGATCLGKTHLHEVALGILGWNPLAGQAKNPLDPTRIAGGSSSGAAISVATGEADFALGSDTGGSVRIPAALCGVVGFKPTYGRYSLEGALPLSRTCDHAGLLARDVTTVQRVDAALFGHAPQPAVLEGLRVGFWDVPGWTTERVWTPFERIISKLAAQPFDFPDVLETYSDLVQIEAARVHATALERDDPGFGAPTLALLRRGQALPESRYRAVLEERDALRARLERTFKDFDILLAPAVPDLAPTIGADMLELPGEPAPLRPAFLRLTAPFSLLGVPTVSLPLRVGALSCGVQLIGRWGSDESVLALARALERLLLE